MGTVTQYNLANVQAALGGANPISMSEYYRGGAYVPSARTVATTVYEPAGGGWTVSGNTYWNTQPNVNGKYGVTPGQTTVLWNGAQIYYNQYDPNLTSVTVSGITYYRGPLWSGYVYYIRRTYPSSYQQSINTGVPSSGAISISQLYGAENP
jgi:hypothetical protein